MTKCRIFCDSNPSPVRAYDNAWQNYPTHDHMVNDLHFEQIWIVQASTLTRFRWWANEDGSLKKREQYAVDPTLENPKYADPPTEAAIKAVCNLSRDARHFGMPIQGDRIPIMFDVEVDSFDAEKVGNLEVLWNCAITLMRVKKALGPGTSTVCGMGWLPVPDDPEAIGSVGDALIKGIAAKSDYFCRDFYNHNVRIKDPETWYEDVDDATKYAENFSLPRMAVICPTKQVWNIPETDPFYIQHNDKPADLGEFKKQARYLVDRDWHLCMWTALTPLEPVRALLGAVNEMQI